jgi:putative nucleotidyltransferase with HDIG domain
MDLHLEEELWFGETDDAPAEAAAARSLVARTARIVNLRPCPPVVTVLLSLVTRRATSVADMRRVIEADPTLASRILRLVNSSAFALRNRCTSIEHALVLLGRQIITDLCVAMALLDVQAGHAEALQRNVRMHSSAVGGVARQLAMMLGIPTDEIFTAGLLHDLGKILELQLGEAEGYASLLERANDWPDHLHIFERKRHGYDHAALGAHVLRAWKIPEPLPMLVALHHQPGRAISVGGDLASKTMVLRLADQLCYLFDEEDMINEASIEAISRTEAMTFLDLSAADLTAQWNHLRQASQDSQRLFTR